MQAGTTLVVSFLFATAATAQLLDFAPRVDYDLAAEMPVRAVTADFDNDGHLDVAVTNKGWGNGRVSVQYGDGAGDFGNGIEFLAQDASGLAAGDFDGDGWVDLVVSPQNGYSRTVWVVPNDGAGAFGLGIGLGTNGVDAVALTSADLDGNGTLDVVAGTSSSGNAITWFPGNGDLTFGVGRSPWITNGYASQNVSAADVDGDGDEDLVLGHGSGLQVFTNDGTGNFSAGWAMPLFERIADQALVELDHDGVLDLVTSSDGAVLRSWHGVGDGTFVQLSMVPSFGYSPDFAMGDIDGDGELDALQPGYLWDLRIALNQGNGIFGPTQLVPTGLEPLTVALGDWDEDGALDLAAGCRNSGFDSYLSVHLQLPGARPTLASVTPDHGPSSGLAAVTLAGTQLDGITAVSFGGTSVPFTVLSSSALRAEVPPGLPLGWLDVSVQGSGGSASLPRSYDVFATPLEVGTACSASRLGWSGAPCLGQGLTITTSNLAGRMQVLLLDWSNQRRTRPLAVPLRSPCPGPRCALQLVPDTALALGRSAGTTLAIPADPALVGVHLRMQAVVRGCPVVTTQALDFTLGP